MVFKKRGESATLWDKNKFLYKPSVAYNVISCKTLVN